MKLAISGGGTGGHVYPALAAVQALPPSDLRWIGSVGGMEQELVTREGLPFEAIEASGLRGKNPLIFAKGLWQLSRGYQQSRELLRRFQPQVLFVTGGYVCVPVTLAARRLNIPVIIYLPDIEPGLAIKFLSRFAAKVAVTAPDAQQFFNAGQTVVTGYPVRADLVAAAEQPDKAGALATFGLSDTLPTLLIFGGSRGARSLNKAVTARLEAYLDVCQIIHVSGTLDAAWVQARREVLPEALQTRYVTAAYLHDQMIAALLAADLVLSRAGASTLGEFPIAGLPAVLVPYPYAGAHQWRNAAYLTEQGAAIAIDDAALDKELEQTVLNLITNHPKLEAMRQAARRLAQPQAAARLAQEILEVATYVN